jgi:hypothetical protein
MKILSNLIIHVEDHHSHPQIIHLLNKVLQNSKFNFQFNLLEHLQTLANHSPVYQQEINRFKTLIQDENVHSETKKLLTQIIQKK